MVSKLRQGSNKSNYDGLIDGIIDRVIHCPYIEYVLVLNKHVAGSSNDPLCHGDRNQHTNARTKIRSFKWGKSWNWSRMRRGRARFHLHCSIIYPQEKEGTSSPVSGSGGRRTPRQRHKRAAKYASTASVRATRPDCNALRAFRITGIKLKSAVD